MPSNTRKKERLPPGFLRTNSGSLRVQIRITGHRPVVRTFPVFEDSPVARKRQFDEAEAWAVETRRKKAGNLVDTRKAEVTTLSAVLRRYEEVGLKGKDSNARKDRNRIRQLLADPIALRPIIGLKKADLAAYREELMGRGRAKSIDVAMRRLVREGGPDAATRLGDLRRLEEMRADLTRAEPSQRRELERRISEVEAREGVKGPARTTVTNKVQLITRALKLASETMEGVPDLTGVPMPSASRGRDRRLTQVELDLLLAKGAEVHPLLPPVIKFAVATALRRERIFEFNEGHVVDIGAGKRAIVFPRDGNARRKRTGVIPLTREIRAIVDEGARVGATVGTDDVSRTASTSFAINPVTFDHHWRRLVLECGLDGLHFHDLRHEATSRLFERGLSVAEVMSITGHSTTDMADRYSHYSAALVLEKLEGDKDPERLLAEINFLIRQYASLTSNGTGIVIPAPAPT